MIYQLHCLNAGKVQFSLLFKRKMLLYCGEDGSLILQINAGEYADNITMPAVQKNSFY